MVDSVVSVSLRAQIDGLVSGLAEASSAMKDAAESIRSSMDGVKDAAEGTESKLGELTESVKRFFEFEYVKEGIELLEEGIERVKEGFESTVGKAVEFGLSTAKFAAVMGTSQEQAAGLTAALRNVGVSADEYASIALRMQMRVNADESAFKQMGVATRDAHGQLLTGKELMDSAIATMRTYREGADQNAFAIEVFGKRAADVYAIQKVGNDAIQHQIDLYKQMGVDLSGVGEDALSVDDAVGDLKTEVEGLGIALGQQMLPTAKAALQWLGGDGKGFLQDLADAVSLLAKDFLDFSLFVVESVEAVINAWYDLNKASLVAAQADQMGTSQAIDSAIASTDAAKATDKRSSAIRKLTADLAALQTQMAASAAANAVHPPLLPPDEDGVPSSLARPKENPFAPGGGSRKFVAPKKGPRDNSAEQEIEADKNLQLAQVAGAEETNQHLLAMGKETVDAFVAQEVDLENKKHAIQLDALQQELQLPNRTKEELQKTHEAIQALEVAHQNALVKLDQDAESRKAALAKAALDEAQKADDARLASGLETLKQQATAGQLGAVEAINREIALTKEIEAQELARLDAEIGTLTAGTKAYDDAVKARTELEKKFNKDVANLQKERFTQAKADADQWLQPLANSFKQSFEDMAAHGKSFGDAMKGVFSNMAEAGATALEQYAVKQAATAVAQITTNAGVAASGAASSQASIPYVGPVLAAAAAAAMLGLVLGYTSLASAAGGMVVDRDQLALVHKNEMILPAHLAGGMQQIISNGGGSSRGGDTSIHQVNHITGGPHQDVLATLRAQPRQLAAILKQMQRDGHI